MTHSGRNADERLLTAHHKTADNLAGKRIAEGLFHETLQYYGVHTLVCGYQIKQVASSIP